MTCHTSGQVNFRRIFITGRPAQCLLSAALAAAVYGLLLLAAIGCIAQPQLPASVGVAQSEALNAKADARIDAAKSLISLGQSGFSRDLFKVINEILDKAKADLVAQSVSLARALSDQQAAARNALEWKTKYDGEKADNGNLRADFWSVRQHRLLRWVIWGLVIACVLRGAALAGGGWIGSIAALISTAIFAVLSFGVAGIQSLFDNVWFRFFAKNNLNAKTPSSQGGDVPTIEAKENPAPG